MKCWRDLSQECAGSNCPMWMEGFEVPDIDEGSGIGLNQSKCALVIKEKIALYQGLMDMVELVEALEERSNEGFLQMLDDAFDEPPKKKPKKREDPSRNMMLLPEEGQPAPTRADSSPRKKRGKNGNAEGPA